MPCQRLAVKDAEGAAQRAKLLDGEGHGHTLSRVARPPALAIVLSTSRPACSAPLPFSQPRLRHARYLRCRLPTRLSTKALSPPWADLGVQLVRGSHA